MRQVYLATVNYSTSRNNQLPGYGAIYSDIAIWRS